MATVTLAGDLVDLTGRSVEEITNVIVKAAYATPAPGGVTTTQPRAVEHDRGRVSIQAQEGVRGWLHIDGDGWSDSIPFVAAAGMTQLWEAVANALPIAKSLSAFLDLKPMMQKMLDEAVAAAPSSLRWVKRHLEIDEDLNDLTSPGIYEAHTTAMVSTLKNVPPTAGAGGQRITVTPAGNGRVFQEWLEFGMDAQTRKWSRGLDQTGEWSSWVRDHPEITVITSDTDLNDLRTPGDYEAVENPVIRTLKNTPTTSPQSAYMRVSSFGNGRVLQRWTSGTAEGPGNTYERMLTTSGMWSSWSKLPSHQWWRKPELGRGTDLDALPVGYSYFTSGPISRTLLNRPDGLSGPGYVETFNAGSASFQILVAYAGNDVGFRVWRRATEDGKYRTWVEETPGVGSGGGVSAARWLRTDPIYVWGDSEVANHLAKELAGVVTSTSVVNRGGWGWSSNDILLRAGAIELFATPVGGVIPASADQEVALNVHGRRMQTRYRDMPVTFAGVRGTLTHKEDEQWTFKRGTPGAEVQVPKPAQLVSVDAMTPGRGTHIFIMGGNDWLEEVGAAPERDKVTHVVANYARAVEAVAPSPTRHVLIAGVKTRADTRPGDANDEFVKEVNDRLAKLFPQFFVSRQDWLVNDALRLAGITANDADTSNAAGGVAPPSVFEDHTHTRVEVAKAEATHLWLEELRTRGWAN